MKRLILVGLIAALLLLLSGCVIVPQQEAAKPEEKILLTVLAGESTSDPGMAELIRERIEKAFPNVELEWENVDWGERFSVRLNAMISSGETPDIIVGKAQDIQAFYPTGALGVFPTHLGEALVPEAMQAGTANGQLYGLVYNQLYQGVLYNKNMFYRYNFKVPETEAELDAIIDRLHRVGVTPFASHFQETWHTGNILMQFLIESVVLSGMGGVLGLIAGYATMTVFERYFGMEVAATIEVAQLALGFSMFVGIVFGLYPANKASKLKPIDALHYS